MINQLVDIQSVDILRGPQGTLFGRNTLSGAIQFTTVKPDHDGTGFGEVTFGNYGLLNLSGAVSVSASDELAFRFTGFSSQRDGYVDNLTTAGEDEINDRDRYGFRAQALWEPTDTVSVHVIADYAELDEICCGFSVLYDNNRADQRSTTASILGTDTYLASRGGTVVSEDRVFEDVQATSFNPESSSEDQGISIQVDWDLEDFTLTSITAFRNFESFDRIDADFTDLDALEDRNAAEQEQFSQELRLSFVGENLNYVVGANVFIQELNSNSQLDFGSDTELFAEVFSNLPVGTFGGVGSAFPADGFAFDINEQEHESWAVFAQADYRISEALTLTAGLRYSDEQKDLVANYFESGNELGFNLTQFAATLKRNNVDESIAEDQITGTIKLSWFANEDVMLYTSYSTGYKAGGTNTDRIDPSFDQTFEKETSTSIEVGVKAEFPDQGVRLNAAIYQAAIDDQQVGSFSGAGFNVQNAATADTKGLELEMLWQPSENTTVNVGYSKAIADVDEFEKGNCRIVTPFRTGVADPGASIEINGIVRPAQTVAESFSPSFCDRSGGRLAVNPEDKLIVGVRRDYVLSDSVVAYGKAEWSHVGDMQLLASNDPLTLQDSYNTFNVRMGLILDEYNSEVTLWGRNITNEDYLGIAFDGVLQTGKIGAYSREPATYGITFNTKF